MINAKWVERSTLITLAEVPELRAYWEPFPGQSSTCDSLRNFGALRIREIAANLLSEVNWERVVRNEKIEKGNVVSKVGRYAHEPEGKHTKDNSLFEKGTNRSVETTPGTAERNVLLTLNNRILLKVLPLERIMMRPLRLDRPASHFLRKVRVETSDFDNQRDLKDRM